VPGAGIAGDNLQGILLLMAAAAAAAEFYNSQVSVVDLPISM
jgi:hypothetical protein